MSVEAVARAIAFTEDNLREPVDVAAMAAAAHYSLYHFCRLFSRHTGLSPHTYLVRRRLTLAAEPVLASTRRIVDIAVDSGFSSHEGFSRAFARLFAATPLDARSRGWVPNPPRLPALTPEHLDCRRRHDGLAPLRVPDELLPERDEGMHTVPLVWPCGGLGPEPGPGGASRLVTFQVSGEPHDLLLVLDWLVHVWLFATRSELGAPGVLVDRDGTRVRVPIRRVGTIGT